MKEELKNLLDLLDIEQIEANMFRGVSPAEGWQRVYGGQVIGQALVAASRTVEDESRAAHSLHGYFLRPGDTAIPILYSAAVLILVESLRYKKVRLFSACQFLSR